MEKEKDEFEFVLPIGEDLPYDSFYFVHQDGNSQHATIFQESFCDDIVRHFVDFLRGCGHYDDPIYESMRGIANEYFASKEKLRQPLPLQQDDLN